MNLSVDIEGKAFGGHPVLGSIRFQVERGEALCLYGPSGCGKSTILRIVAGLDPDYRGSVALDGRLVRGPGRRIGIATQRVVAYDWLTVGENVAFGLRYANGRTADPARVDELGSMVGLRSEDLAKRPAQISGGMLQRMALARALATEPDVILLDEPFSALDFDSRVALQQLVVDLRKRTGTAFVCVSHDPEEVLVLATRVSVLGRSPTVEVDSLRPTVRRDDAGSRYSAEFAEAKRDLRARLAPGAIGREAEFGNS